MLEAIADLRQSAANYVGLLERYSPSAQSPYTVNMEAMEQLGSQHDYYEQSLRELRKQALVAGSPYQSIVEELIRFVMYQVLLKEGQRDKLVKLFGIPDEELVELDAISFSAKLADMTQDTVNKIDQISGRVPDTEDFQN